MENPLVNSVLGKNHQVLVILSCMVYFQNNYLDEEDPWLDILTATYFAVQSTHHATL